MSSVYVVPSPDLSGQQFQQVIKQNQQQLQMNSSAWAWLIGTILFFLILIVLIACYYFLIYKPGKV